MSEILFEDVSYTIVGFAMKVHRKLGYGYLEKVYENSMMVLLHRGGIEAKQQHPVTVHFEGVVVGTGSDTKLSEGDWPATRDYFEFRQEQTRTRKTCYVIRENSRSIRG
jgi:hypothetical protein